MQKVILITGATDGIGFETAKTVHPVNRYLNGFSDIISLKIAS
ncbi:hypothetical protein PY250_23355 (plasmid) [Vibrio alginolyticus]|nr:hypothetical protein [Vibrio alginolyticus]WEK81854.1 hypothetical protein PY250_23355 [Vibrio alginolyticus]